MSIEKGIKSIGKFDTVQLKQRIIHLQAELSRYKQMVENYQNNYHYNQLEELKTEMAMLSEFLIQKDEEIAQMQKIKTENEEYVKVLIEEKSQFDDTYLELNERIQQLENENSRFKEEIDLLNVENNNLRNSLNDQENEMEKFREVIRLGEGNKSSLQPKKTTVDYKKETDPADSWFLRTLKQQNKENDKS